MKLYLAMRRDVVVITWVQVSEGLPPTKFGSVKTPKFRRDFWQLSTLSGNDRHNEKMNSKWSTTTPPTFGLKIWWSLVHKQKSYRRACWPTQLDFFRETIFWLLGGAVPSNFYTPYHPLNLYFQLDMGCQAASSWALPHINSLF